MHHVSPFSLSRTSFSFYTHIFSLSSRSITFSRPRGISSNTRNMTANGITPSEGSGRRKLKILMIHGYTQSGPSFNSKTKALTKLLNRQFPPSHPIYPGGIQLLYPTGPIPLLPADIPGYTPSSDPSLAPTDAYGWWKRETGGARYAGIEKGLQVIASTIQEAGGIDGVIGFSQGACAAYFVASLLEMNRESAFALQCVKNPSEALPYPASFTTLKQQLRQPPLKFCILYSGFYAPYGGYEAFYNPPLKTRVLHVIGSLDTVVEEHRSMALVEASEEGSREVCFHPGGHFVPMGKEFGNVAVGFMVKCLDEKKPVVEESVEDMDVPF
ncbi:aab153fe-8683-457f-a660-5a94b05e8ff2 [Sclerotinia trifoliorum]|uniref:Aab153fe-8683-457f-a660-5a94b05e8ff2 n=1 Tax=Sclerotinia trifoliorum TaxID=28548 RepID=A0A8H2ZRN4_9HELO|nr:aab153fe-8683-457f-a660-5a94b05e8ff2 [Sclerotinia trifoliorum]